MRVLKRKSKPLPAKGKTKKRGGQWASEKKSFNFTLIPIKRPQLKPREGYYRGPDVLAHELVGHGYDTIKRDPRDNQSTAIRLANLVRECMGNKQPQRSQNDN